MHELGIANGIVEFCAERAGTERVTRVRFCFDVCAKDTVVEGALLEIIETPGRAICRDCNGEVAMTQLFERCRCGGANLRIVAGEEMKIREMELA
jgi:hydrogenase nickel incorporation protein HypA/HybF